MISFITFVLGITIGIFMMALMNAAAYEYEEHENKEEKEEENPYDHTTEESDNDKDIPRID